MILDLDNPTDTASFHSAKMSAERGANASMSKELNVISPAKEALHLCHSDSSDTEKHLSDGGKRNI